MKIKAVKCYQCDTIIYSRCKQDVRACNCFDLDRDKRGPWISIMGGLKDPRVSSQHRSCFQIVDIQIKDDIVPKLYRDWVHDLNKYGLIDLKGDEDGQDSIID